MSKFKIGETVYLKGKIQDYDGLSVTYSIDLCGERFIFREDDRLYTKKEMLAELTKPEPPKVGQVWMQDGCENINIVAVTDHNVFFEYDDKDSGSANLTYFFANYKKVEP